MRLFRKIPYGRQFIGKDDIENVCSSLNNDLLTTGKYVDNFESKIKNLLNVKFAIACSSGTAALHLALMSFNLKKNDIIIMPAINFIAVYNISKYIGLKIFLADVDPFTGQMTPQTLLHCIKKNNLKNIKVVVTMYLGGYPENIIKFYEIKKKFNFFILEDACHALGAKYNSGKKKIYIGCCKHSDIAVFSLHPVKTITSGEGGLIATNNKIFYNRQKIMRSHGIIRNEKLKHWKYNVSKIGFNYRLSDLNCALGLSQLKKINKFINYRRKIYDYYKLKLLKFNNIIKINSYDEDNCPSYHLFLISINFKKLKTTKEKLFIYLKKNRIYSQYHYIPIYKFKVFSERNFFLPNSEFYFNRTISLPIFFNFSRDEHNYVLSKLELFFSKNLKC
jgi:dTDP-4-amino-4,6-dideoxygalactose transaminase